MTSEVLEVLAAASRGDNDTIRLLLHRGDSGSVNLGDMVRGTPLHVAATAGHLRTVLLLLASGANVHVAKSNGDTALHAACREGRTSVASALLHAGASPAMTNIDGNTPLHLAAFNQRVDTVELLVTVSGTDVNARNALGETPLSVAVRAGVTNSSTICALLNAGADPNVIGTRGRSIIQKAVICCTPQVVTCLLGHGVDVNAVVEGSASSLRIAAERRECDMVAHLLAAGAKFT